MKNARIRFDNEKVGESKFEVFFPRDAKNHPGNNSNEPNWFYYWKDHMNANYTLIYGGAGPGNGTAAEVKAMTKWSYTVSKDKQEITIYDATCGKFKAYGVGKEYSGIDSFFSTVIHESKHCDQISSADQLVATGTNGPWKNGWSFNVGNLHNHWSVGKDKKPGVANVDDDMDGNVDNLLATGPGELGYGDDIDLTHPATNSRNWPAVWAPPENLLVPSEIETEAIQASNQQHDEHDEARNDWGDPGKNHKTIDVWDD